ncbi:MAG: N-acetylmuramoyl-L-alanine amidase [uncultured Chloroflexi bacterium]|uniref:N-acetylmuramoyl-L-alanine amidase n=1 Tax=uncultured Chloroflexota bacterium TaxID=166587 RepID=A0A6J4I468_9CHLR|nr:MAG: N-acetylmuramoyl-L-alanine amidase [uncultured Chloroflexota bacterium]
MDQSPTDHSTSTTTEGAIRSLDTLVGHPHPGFLPLEMFLFISRHVPLFTVDLWIQDASGRVLLTWRDDAYFGSGWHVPGSALRFQETIAHRLHECAREELGATVDYDPTPMALMEEIEPQVRTRGHNVSAAYRCRLLTPPDPSRAYHAGAPQQGQWAWHAACPPDLLPVHRVYAEHFPVAQPPRSTRQDDA